MVFSATALLYLLTTTPPPGRYYPWWAFGLAGLGVVAGFAALIATFLAKAPAPARFPLTAEERAALSPKVEEELKAEFLEGLALDDIKPNMRIPVRKGQIRRRLEEIEELWMRTTIEIPACPPVVHRNVVWTPELSQVEHGVMLTLRCSDWNQLVGIRCRVDDQHAMKHLSEVTQGPGALMEAPFKYPDGFPGAPAFPRQGWHSVSWFHADDDPEVGAIDPGLGKEILTCRFNVRTAPSKSGTRRSVGLN
jgi:hypothetical protein